MYVIVERVNQLAETEFVVKLSEQPKFWNTFQLGLSDGLGMLV